MQEVPEKDQPPPPFFASLASVSSNGFGLMVPGLQKTSLSSALTDLQNRLLKLLTLLRQDQWLASLKFIAGWNDQKKYEADQAGCQHKRC